MSLFAAGLNRPLGPYNFTGHIGFKMQCAARNVEGLVKRRSRFRRRARDCCVFRCGGRHSDCGGEQHHKSQNRSRESFDTFHFCSSFSFFCARCLDHACICILTHKKEKSIHMEQLFEILFHGYGKSVKFPPRLSARPIRHSTKRCFRKTVKVFPKKHFRFIFLFPFAGKSVIMNIYAVYLRNFRRASRI